MTISIYNSTSECAEIRNDWNDLAKRSAPKGIYSSGACNTFEWISTLEKTRLKDENVKTVAIVENDQINGLFPFYIDTQKFLSLFTVPCIHHATDLYGSRMTPLMSPQQTIDTIEYLDSQLKKWSKFTFIHVDKDSKTDFDSSLEGKFNYTKTLTIDTPHIELNKEFEDFESALDRKFRKNLRSRTRQLEKIGNVEFKIIEKLEDVDFLLSSMYQIEKNTWKEQAGSSITQNTNQKLFYDNYTVKAASQDLLKGFILLLDDKPIAYSYGILFNGVLESLKSSYDEDYKKYGVGNIIKFEIFKHLHLIGVPFFDFQGVKEPIKAKWAQDSYKQHRYTIYNNNVLGKLLYYTDKFKNYKNRSKNTK